MNKFYQPVKAEVKSGEVIEFIMAYWLEIISYKGERMERFKFMPELSKVRVAYEEILRVYDVDMRYCRFFNVSEKFKVSESSESKTKGADNIMVFYGLKPKAVQKKKQKPDNELIKGIGMYRNVA